MGTVEGARARLDADEYPDTPAGLRQWAQDGHMVDIEHLRQVAETRDEAISALRRAGLVDLAARVDEHWC